jgi:uncharacterized membrane protein YoaK (UPF0700 family)
MWLSFGLAFVGGYCDAAGFVLAKAFTGHVTGNLVLGAIAVVAHDWKSMVASLSAIVTFLIGVVLSMLVARPLKARLSWPVLPTVMGIEVILIVAASLAFASGMAARVEIFVIFVSFALGLQNGAFRRVGGIGVHTNYLTGTITTLLATEVDKHASQGTLQPATPPDPKIHLLGGIWFSFVLGAGAGAAMTFRFKGLGMLAAALLLIALILHVQLASTSGNAN